MHLSVGDCINVPNFSLLPAPTPFVSDFVVPPTKEEENIFRTLILVLTMWFIITNTKSDASSQPRIKETWGISSCLPVLLPLL